MTAYSRREEFEAARKAREADVKRRREQRAQVVADQAQQDEIARRCQDHVVPRKRPFLSQLPKWNYHNAKKGLRFLGFAGLMLVFSRPLIAGMLLLAYVTAFVLLSWVRGGFETDYQFIGGLVAVFSIFWGVISGLVFLSRATAWTASHNPFKRRFAVFEAYPILAFALVMLAALFSGAGSGENSERCYARVTC
jgi:hypothetical protein